MAFNWRRLLGFGSIPDTTGLGPDFPGSAGDRERGKFRESQYPRLTAVAVVNDDGNAIGADKTSKDSNQLLAELVLEIRLLRQGLILEGVIADIDSI